MNDDVQHQYKTSCNLAKRGSFLGKYGTVNWFEWLADNIAIPENAHVLDVGSGPGWLWKTQVNRLPRGLQLTLVDTSEGMLAEARASLASLTDAFARLALHSADAVELPFEDESFDVVLLLHVLYHVDDPTRALQEAHRVLRPGGRIFVSTNATDNMAELHEIGARAYGGAATDPGAALFSLDQAVCAVRKIFGQVQDRHLTDMMVCTDPDDAVALLLSMPPGNASKPEERAHLAQLLKDEAGRNQGSLRVTRRTGLVEATKQA